MNRLLPVLTLCALLSAGCRRDMFDQPKARTLRASDFFDDGAASRPLVEHTVARGQLHDDEHLFTGKIDGAEAETFPFPITRERLVRGRERFEIYCAVCHGRTGKGDGMIVQRGFRPPLSFDDERLRKAAPGHFFGVITNGFGSMYPQASRVEPEDRWAIAAYIRALQLSRNARIADVPASERAKLEVTQ